MQVSTPAPLTYSIDSGCMGTLTVTIAGCSPARNGSTVYVYKLSDIVGRIEVTQ
jgi:hypothetical protein